MSIAERADSESDEGLLDLDQPAHPVLEPKLDAKWALRLPDFLVVAGAAALYLFVSYLPLTDPALWNAVNYGDWILDHRALPTGDWIMPFAESTRLVDTQWGTEAILALIARGGDSWLTVLAGLVVVATFLTYGRAYWLLADNGGVALATTAAVLAIAWTRYTALRPEHVAGLCFAGLLWFGASVRRGEKAGEASDSPPRWPARRWVLLAALFCVWANLHGSVVWGLVVLFCWALGQAIDVWRSEGRFAAIVADRRVQQWTLALELAIVATCLNPLGVDLLLEVVWFAPRANLQQLSEWQPLVLLRSAGPGFALSVVLLIGLLRLSRARLHTGDVLSLVAVTIAMILHHRFVALYAPLFGFLVAPHVASIWRSRWSPQTARGGDLIDAPEREQSALPPGRAWTYTLLAGLAIWIAFSLSDVSRPLLGGEPRTPQQIYGPQAPLELVEYLEKNPPRQYVFAPAGWGDWLYHHSGGAWQPMATSRVDALPSQVWTDYNHVATSQGGWRNVLRRYQIQTMIVDRRQQKSLATGLRLDPSWEAVYQDRLALVFELDRDRLNGGATLEQSNE